MIAEFKSFGQGSVELFTDKVVIRKSNGATGKLFFGKTSKTIYLNNLTGITIKKGGLTAGHIHFETAASAAKKGYWKNVNDDATIVFAVQSNRAAMKFKEAVERQLEKVNSRGSSGVVSVADELLKLKTLLDGGAITQEDFERMKDELMNY